MEDGIEIKVIPEQDFYDIETELGCHVKVGAAQSIEYAERLQAYVLHTPPVCKLCREPSFLIEVPTANGSFHICDKCRYDIISAPTLAAHQ